MVEMTSEMKRAMARYEEARASYRRVVLASLDGKAKGEAIRRAIAKVREAQQELRRFSPAIRRPASASEGKEEGGSLLPSLGFFRRLLSAG
jgi:hypothetical protein